MKVRSSLSNLWGWLSTTFFLTSQDRPILPTASSGTFDRQIRIPQVSLNISTTSDTSNNRSDHSQSPSPWPSSSPTSLAKNSLFTWHEMLLGMSFAILVALLSVSYEYVEGLLIPAKLFSSNPKLFEVFLTLDALSFTASVIGLRLQSTVYKRASKFLGEFAYACFMIAFYTIVWVLFPSYLKWLPCILLSMVLAVFIYIYIFPQTEMQIDKDEGSRAT